MSVAITPRRVCAVCEAFLGYEHKDTCSASGVVQYGDTTEKWTTVRDSDEHPHIAGTSPYDEKVDSMSFAITLVKGDGDRRSIQAEYDAENKLVQFVKWGEEVFGTLEPVEPEEWRQIVRRLHLGSVIDGATVDTDLRTVAVNALYEAREADKVMDEAAAIVAEKVLAAYEPKIREIAGQAAGAASGVFLRLHPDEVMPSEEVSEAVEGIFASFGISEAAATESDDPSNSSSENDLGERNAAAIERLGDSVDGESLPQLTPDEARALHAVYAGDAFDAEHLETAQPKLEAIAGESWR